MEDVIANVFMYMSAFGCFLCVFSIPKAVVLLAAVFLNNENEIDITYKRITPSRGPHIQTKLSMNVVVPQKLLRKHLKRQLWKTTNKY